jgi:hypothetical protein
MTVFTFPRKLLEWKPKERNMKYLVCLILVITSSAYANGIYKWIDEDGNVHYGDAPPASVATEEVTVDVAPSVPGKPLPRLETSDPGSSTTSSESPANDEPEPEPEVSDEQAENICSQAHRNLTKLNKSRRKARVRNPDGTTRQMNNEERKASREQANQNVKDYCK